MALAAQHTSKLTIPAAALRLFGNRDKIQYVIGDSDGDGIVSQASLGEKCQKKKVSPNRCGTQAPIWLDGVHPTAIGENVVRRACVNVVDLSNGCFTSFDINITKCADDVFVYYLRPPWYCAVGYCAGRFDSFR